MTDTEAPARKRSRSRSKDADADPETVQASTGDLVAALGGDDASEESSAAPSKRGKRGRRRGADETAADPASAPPVESEPPSTGVKLSDELPMAAEDDLTDIEGEASARMVSIVESLLFAANKPLGVREIRQLLKEASLRQVQLALKQLGRDLQGRGIVLAQVAGGFRLRTDPENSRWVQLLLADRPARLSRSQLETLAVIAYRQPVTKPEVDHIRGVDCGAVMKVLLDHDLARIVGRKEEPGRPHLYGTTVKFLEFFNLRSLRDMPDLHEFRELTEESRQLVAEKLGDGALFDERESMGQEVLDWGGEGAEPDHVGAEDDAEEHDDAADDAQAAGDRTDGGQSHDRASDDEDHDEASDGRAAGERATSGPADEPDAGEPDAGEQADGEQADGEQVDGEQVDGEQVDDQQVDDDDEADEDE